MEKTLAVINHLEEEGVIGKYAVAGAVAATRYIEPIQTYDLDVFVLLPAAATGLITLRPIYEYCSRRGYVVEGECIVIEDWPVQFLPVYNRLTEEALQQAREVKFGETRTRVLTAEHLAAIMLETGRPKDHARLTQFFEAEVIALERLEYIVARHGLTAKWQSFRKRFLTPNA